MDDLKITKILILIFIASVVVEASLIYIYDPHKGIKCPNCNSTNTKLWTDDDYLTYECFNCGAYFFEDGYIFMYNFGISKKYNESFKHIEDAKLKNSSA